MTHFLLALFLLGSSSSAPAIAGVLSDKLVYPSSRKHGKPVHVAHCRKAPAGCRARLDAFAALFVEAGAAHGIDPWLLAAMAVKESGLNPFATGRSGERGLLQIHPRHKRARKIRFLRDERYRDKCRKVVGACQDEVVEHAAAILDETIERCGSIEAGLGAYNTGHCNPDASYVKLVRRIEAKLRSWSKEPT